MDSYKKRMKRRFFGIGKQEVPKAPERIDTGFNAGGAPGESELPGWSPAPPFPKYIRSQFDFYRPELDRFISQPGLPGIQIPRPQTNPPSKESEMTAQPLALRNRLPKSVAQTLDTLAAYESKEAVKAMMQRYVETKDFTSESAAFIAGISTSPISRERLDAAIDVAVRQRAFDTSLSREVEEVVIGGGLHAAIYCAVRRELGHPRPIVLEASDRLGGAFGMTSTPTFYLNSRNRPGPLGMPGDDMAGLNVIPGAPVQPCDLSASEYQRNTDLALAIRLTLLMHSIPLVNFRATKITNARNPLPDRPGVFRITGEDDSGLIAQRVIDARGMQFVESERCNGTTVMSYPQFMAHMQKSFPLKGMRRVAVIGFGDSGKTVVEALLGQGPASNWSVAALDWVQRIDWWGCQYSDPSDFRRCVRSRYQGIARFFPQFEEDGALGLAKMGRIKPIGRRAEAWGSGYNMAYVDDRPYDCVIVCTGMTNPAPLFTTDYESSYIVSGRKVGVSVYRDRPFVKVGPIAGIDFSEKETQQIGSIPENKVALFRLADRTATVAANL